MKITSLDIRKQEFNRSFRGYDIDEVDSFLQVLATQWQELVDELRRSGEKVTEQQLKLDHYMKVEEALEEALQTARSSARITIENAEMKARNTLEEAENRVVELQKTADSERLQMKRDTAKYAVRQQEIVAKLRAFLMSEMEILSHFDSENIRPSLAMSAAMKEIELVREESPDALADDEPEPEFEREVKSASEKDQIDADSTSGSVERQDGSRSSWEKLEGESSIGQSPVTESRNDSSENNWNSLEEEEEEEDRDVELRSEHKVSKEAEENGFSDDLEPEEEGEEVGEEEDMPNSDEVAVELDDAPSWRVTPIFNSDDNAEDNSDNQGNETPVAGRHESHQNYKNVRFPGSNVMSEEVGVDDETEAEIRKIHQILKDLDDE